ncbi:prolactin regulatory element-binding protein-like isoform X1 [Stegodyphus dumicola]|uniref:prolactin regulatory element-binding protein-like isoform X1 n=1 Tax=Stegodyphus dumicola TaxID=202533 RepID=UPI0015AF3C72|nr:prolactin regulatory element-binding protein-like isoform X1 [Stegodyphus dumicola]
MLPSKKQNELLARVNFPLYGVRSLSERHVLVAGGGGNGKSGILNVIEIYELIQNGSTCRAESVTHYETGSEAIMSCAIYGAGKYYILFASMAGNCQIYKIKYEIVENDHIEKNSYSDKLSEPYIRKRAHAAEFDSPSQISNLNCKTSDTNDNVTDSKLRFKIQPLESFQTDFSDDPYQKLVKFSSSAKLLVAGGADGHVRLWKYPELKKIHDIAAHLDDVDDLDICPIGKKIVTVSRDGCGKVWNSETGCLITDLKYVLPQKSDGKYIFRSCRIRHKSDIECSNLKLMVHEFELMVHEDVLMVQTNCNRMI